MRPRTKKILLATTIALAALFTVGYAGWRYHYPYGFSHCCDVILPGALQEYARTHGGAFPTGEATPEASLSLLYREKASYGRLADERLLRGKTVPESVVKKILERGELLTPDTCGWHYVEGLRTDDDPRLALFWDKESRAGPHGWTTRGRRPLRHDRGRAAGVHPPGRMG